jgi:hypothetical protein
VQTVDSGMVNLRQTRTWRYEHGRANPDISNAGSDIGEKEDDPRIR